MQNNQSNNWLWIIPLLLLTWWLGARGLSADAIWWDEWRTIYRAGADQDILLTIPQVIQRMLNADPNQSLGYPLLMAIWGRFVGWSDVAARAFSLLAGIPVVAILYRLGRDMESERVGIMAALVIGTSAFFITYLHELRTYSIYTLFAAIAVWAYWNATSKQRLTPITSVGIVIGIAGMLYMHYLSAILAVSVGLYHLIFVPKNRLWWQISGLALLGAILFTPWLGVMLEAVSVAVEDGGRPDVALTTWQNLDQLVYALTNGVYIYLIPVLIGIPFALRHNRAALFTTFAFTVTLVLTLLLHEWLTILAHARYLLVLWVLFPLMVAIGTDRLLQNRYSIPTFAVIALITGGWATFAPQFADHLLPDAYHVFFRPTVRWDTAGDTLQRETTATDAVAIHVDRHPWAVQGAINFYFDGMPARFTMLDQLNTDDYYEFIAGAPRVWFVQEIAEPTNPQLDQFASILQENYTPCSTHNLGYGVTADLYARTEACCLPSDDGLLTYNQPITLESAEVLTDNPVNAVELLTEWQVQPQVPMNTYSVALYIMDNDNNILSQVDVPLPYDNHICSIHTIPLGGVPSGEYNIATTVYAWESGERLTAINPNNGNESDLQLLAPITIP